MQQSHHSSQSSSSQSSSSSGSRSPRDALGLWIEGRTGSGKTTRLIQQFSSWIAQPQADFRSGLIFAASGSNAEALSARLVASSQRQTESNQTSQILTPISFFESEVTAYWPQLMSQLVPQLDSLALSPLRLRPEKEQELAARLWHPELASGQFRQVGISDARLVERTLSLFQLAAASGTAHEQIPQILRQGLPSEAPESEAPDSEAMTDWDCAGMLLERWWCWCLERGLLTYSIITELYWRYLLPQTRYQSELTQRFSAVFADDLDEYPAVMRSLLELFLDRNLLTVCTFNPIGAVRLGLRADPDDLAKLAERVQIERLADPALGLGVWQQPILAAIHQPLTLLQLPDAICALQTVSKAQLLRQMADLISAAVVSGQVRPSEIAVIAPGLDAITRYTLQSIFSRRQIPLISLNSQQPLVSSSLVRALLSLMALVYPGQGQWLSRESVAEMLVVLLQPAGLDPVRAGLLADYCFAPNPSQPQLLAATEFSRWDRLGYQATAAYENFLSWLAAAKLDSASIAPVDWLERVVQQFFPDCHADQLAALQQLLETAQHYWQVESRLLTQNGLAQEALSQPVSQPMSQSVSQFIQLLRSGVIPANPTAEDQANWSADWSANQPSAAITLATVYQYRSAKCRHRWQFWLDAGSPFWLTGGVMLFGAPLFWQSRPQQAWTAADHLAAAQANLDREVADLLSRATERIYLCHSELGINGEEQSGALMPLVSAALPVDAADWVST